MSGDVQVRFCERLGVKFPRATHLVVGFQIEADAERFRPSLRERFARFGLTLHPRKRASSNSVRYAAEPASAGRREAGDVQLPRLHAQLREEAEGTVHGLAADDARSGCRRSCRR